MKNFDLADDEVLLALLSETLVEADPVPDQAVAVARAVASLHAVDDELAALVADTVLDQEVVLFRHDLTMERLGELSDRMISFATPQIDVDVELQGDGRTVFGAITPAIAVDVELETTGATAATRSDELGRFRLEAPPGPCRLRIHALGGAVITPWITR